MRSRIIFAGLGMALAIGAVPAFAQALGDGGPCDGKPCPVSDAPAATVDDDGITYSTPEAFEITRPATNDRGAYIAQVGNGNRAVIDQTASTAFARVDQNGDGNSADIGQRGAPAYAWTNQQGSTNDVAVDQTGAAAGGNTLYALQTGNRNSTRVAQFAAGGSENGAILSQSGSDNAMTLSQEGGDNAAILSQTGDGNALTASQLGEGNRLIWTQIGNNISNLAITQSGNQALQVTQTK